MLDNKLAFQIQDIKNDCLMLAYDNKEYYEYNKEIQRKLLINDVEQFGIKIKDYNNINRFRLLQNNKDIKMTIEEIVNQMNNYIEIFI